MAIISTSTLHDPNVYEIPSQIVESCSISEASPDAAECQRARYLIKRLNLLWFDLGLDKALPAGWVLPTSAGLVFGQLTLKQSGNLIATLEDHLTTSRNPASCSPGRTLDEGDALWV